MDIIQMFKLKKTNLKREKVTMANRQNITKIQRQQAKLSISQKRKQSEAELQKLQMVRWSSRKVKYQKSKLVVSQLHIVKM